MVNPLPQGDSSKELLPPLPSRSEESCYRNPEKGAEATGMEGHRATWQELEPSGEGQELGTLPHPNLTLPRSSSPSSPACGSTARSVECPAIHRGHPQGTEWGGQARGVHRGYQHDRLPAPLPPLFKRAWNDSNLSGNCFSPQIDGHFFSNCACACIRVYTELNKHLL